MLTLILLLVLAGFVTFVAHISGWKVPLWVPVLCLLLIELVRVIPVGR